MKKTIILAIVITLLLTALCSCGKTPATPSVSSTPTVQEEIDISSFREVKASSENIHVYREEVTRRTENAQGDDIFISDKDWDVIQLYWDESDILSKGNVGIVSYSKLYKETSDYCYPVVFRDGESLIMWYTTESGSVLLEELYGNLRDSNFIGQAHYDLDNENELILECHDGSATIYNQETGEVSCWSFGKKMETTNVVKGGIYCGHSHFEGYIFRLGSDVYALRTRFFEEGKQVECIAHNVKYVIDSSYSYGSDPWSQPLFLMNDGTVKCYVSWEGNEDAAPDDSSHLCDLQYEGSYQK